MEIKFRGKIKYNGNHRFSGDWVYGYYLYDQNTEIHYIKESDDVDGLGTYIHDSFEVIPESVGQFTGLKDKNDVEIYHKDIVNAREQGKVSKIKHMQEVIFYYGCFMLAMLPNKIRLRNISATFMENDVEVIGNTTDNPELFEH